MKTEGNNDFAGLRSAAERDEFIAEKERFLAEFLTREQAIHSLAFYMCFAEEAKASISMLRKLAEKSELKQLSAMDCFDDNFRDFAGVAEWHVRKVESLLTQSSDRGKAAADARHDRPGGSRDKRQAMLDIWASGKYTVRNICAEEECAGVGLSFSKARKHLIGTADNPKSKNKIA